VSNILTKNAQSEDLAIIFPGFSKFILDYYSLGTNVDVKPFPADYRSVHYGYKLTEDNIRELQSDVLGHNRVWLISFMEGEFGGEQLLKTLNESYENKHSASYLGYAEFVSYNVTYFEKRISLWFKQPKAPVSAFALTAS